VERGTVAAGKMRVSIGLTVAGAVLLMVGVITVFVGEVMRLKSPHGWQGTVGLGEVVAAGGLGCGLALLAVVAAGRPGRRRPAARSRSAWRRDSADEWLSPLRNPVAPHTPEPTRWSGEPLQEFSPALDYSDDGWRTESAAGFAAEPGPPEPPEPPVRQRGGAHRAAGPLASHLTDRESGQPIIPSPLSASPATGIEEPADTTLARFS
jgi:hypothetical protein